VSLGIGTLHAQEHPKISARPVALIALDGDWVMSGNVMGKPVIYRMAHGSTLHATMFAVTNGVLTANKQRLKTVVFLHVSR